MGLDFRFTDGQTLLDDDEKEGLRISTITTRADLDEFEQQNIEEALVWLMGKRLKAEQIFTEEFVRVLHKKMYGTVWQWAGSFRTSNKNIGVDKWLIPSELKMLLDDALFWYHEDTFTPPELAVRFKHRLVSIHCFPNGNGRHSRLLADTIIEKLYKKPPFSWGALTNKVPETQRQKYLYCLRQADMGNVEPLVQLACN